VGVVAEYVVVIAMAVVGGALTGAYFVLAEWDRIADVWRRRRGGGRRGRR